MNIVLVLVWLEQGKLLKRQSVNELNFKRAIPEYKSDALPLNAQEVYLLTFPSVRQLQCSDSVNF
jgi:hypothetical protein